MKIYLAARWSRRTEMQALAKRLESLGHTVTSRWLREEHDWNGLDVERGCELANDDLADIDIAELCIHFTETPRTPVRGGRHAEFGYALAMCSFNFIVGPREHVFHCHSEAEHFDTVEEMLEFLSVMAHCENMTAEQVEAEIG